jgi:hypothetical protein
MYFVLYFTVNYLAFFIVNTTVEVTLLRKLHAELKEKRTRRDDMQMASLSRARSSASSITPMSFRRRRKLEIEERSEQRAIIMVVINTIVNFWFRLPELFLLLATCNSLFANSDINFLWQFFNIFPTLTLFWTDLAYFCYILTFTTNFFIYFLFNQKFKQTFAQWMRVKKKQIT